MTIGVDRFRILEVLLRTRSPSAAAVELGITQSAVSKALAQLRLQLKDKLLVRRGDRMVLTPRAERMMTPLAAALASLGALMSDSGDRQRPSAITVAMRDQFAMALGPALLRLLAKESPDTVLRIMPYDRERLADQLMQGGLDAAIAVEPPDSPGLMSALLYHESFVCLTRHADPPTLEDYVAARHIVVSAHSSFSGVDAALRAAGHDRKVTVHVPYFAAALHMAKAEGLLLTLPKTVADATADTALYRHPVPIAVPGFSVHLVWDGRYNDDPANRWMRNLLRRAARSSRSG